MRQNKYKSNLTGKKYNIKTNIKIDLYKPT